MNDIICAICGTKQQKILLYPANFDPRKLTANTFSARRNPDKIHYQLNKCLNCGLIFSSPIFSNKKINYLYSKSVCSYKPEIKYLTKTYLNIFYNNISNLSKNITILEIGCGNGFFLNALSKKGFKNLYGVEPSKKMVNNSPKILKKRIEISVFKKNLFSKEMFDIICCFHTLDHVSDPNELISESRRVLKRNGRAIFVVHNTDALSAKMFGEKSPIFDIEHIYLFNKNTLSRIFTKNGFYVKKIADLTNTFPLGYWLKMAGISVLVKNVLIHTSKFLKIQNLNVSLKGGNIYILADKK